MTTVLWVDDHIDNLGAFVEALSANGFEVYTANSYASGVLLLNNTRFDIVLADINMPDTNGISLLRDAEAQQPHAVLVALSSYLYRKAYIDQLSTFSIPVELIDKIIPAPTSPEFVSVFVRKLNALLTDGVRLTVSDQVRNSQEIGNRNPFKVKFEDWLNMPVLERDALVDEAYSRAKVAIEKAFEDGCIWVFLCGSPDEIRASARSESDILSDDLLIEYARKRDSAPYHFSASMGVEDLWGGECSGSYNLKNYPTVTFSTKADNITIHFDTGNPTSLISYEYLRENGYIKDPITFGRSTIYQHPYRYTSFSIGLMLLSQEEGGPTKFVQVSGQAIRDWEQHPLARKCMQDCSGEVADGLCHYRLGLIGRSLLIENEISITLDGKSRRTLLI